MIRCFDQTFKDKRVFVTGHTGFKGAWLSLWLKELGAEVLGYALESPTDPSLFEAVGLQHRINHVVGDIRDEDRLFSVLHEFAPQFVFHLAAQPMVRLAYGEPKLTYETNVMGTVNLFEAVRKTGSVRVVVNVTSDKCYENREWLYGYRETDPMGGYDPYSSSKGCAELVTSAYRRSFFNHEGAGANKVSLSSARAGNVIGGGDWGKDRLIPDCVRAVSEGKEVMVRNPKAIRPWQHVLEPLSGYLTLGALMYEDGRSFGGGWNFGPYDGEALSVEDVVGLAIKCWGKGGFSIDASSHPHEAALLKLDCSKAKALLKWRPVYDIYRAVEETIRWYKDFYDAGGKGNMCEMTIDQIKGYIEHAREKGIEWSIK